MPCDGTGEYITFADAARSLRIPMSTIERWARDGRLATEVTADGVRVLRRADLGQMVLPGEPPPPDA